MPPSNKPPTVSELCDRVEAAIGRQDKTHFVQRIVNDLRQTFTDTPSPQRNADQSRHLVALGICFAFGDYCKKNPVLSDLLYEEGISRSPAGDVGKTIRILHTERADRHTAKIIPLRPRKGPTGRDGPP